MSNLVHGYWVGGSQWHTFEAIKNWPGLVKIWPNWPLNVSIVTHFHFLVVLTAFGDDWHWSWHGRGGVRGVPASTHHRFTERCQTINIPFDFTFEFWEKCSLPPFRGFWRRGPLLQRWGEIGEAFKALVAGLEMAIGHNLRVGSIKSYGFTAQPG